MILSGKNGDSFELELVGYQFPLTQHGDDANWLIVRTSAVVGGQRWESVDPSLMTSEVKRLADWLNSIVEGRPADSVEYFTEPNMTFEVLDSSDHHLRLRVLLELESRAPWLKKADVGESSHGPTIECSKGKLAKWARDMKTQLLRFPPR